jgi:uncharacterized protein YjbJ (UPF0337 family)
MNKARVKGMMNEVAGCAKRKAGEMTDNPKLEVEGMVQQMKGKVENAWGKTKDAARDAIQDTELHIDTHVIISSKNSTANAEHRKCK